MDKKEWFDLLDYIPQTIVTSSGKAYPLIFSADEYYISLSYQTEQTNNAHCEYSFPLKRFIRRNQETFEVLGLLQAEMGKT